ncbi:hypothetical protein LTR53_007899 [Teratosphaeriaceae sp. CCFEE 6253]|nr:hypothetical protein LTR53_007899 [Teratosphaeriaceae sp. CCFEE 6253]
MRGTAARLGLQSRHTLAAGDRARAARLQAETDLRCRYADTLGRVIVAYPDCSRVENVDSETGSVVRDDFVEDSWVAEPLWERAMGTGFEIDWMEAAGIVVQEEKTGMGAQAGDLEAREDPVQSFARKMRRVAAWVTALPARRGHGSAYVAEDAEAPVERGVAEALVGLSLLSAMGEGEEDAGAGAGAGGMEGMGWGISGGEGTWSRATTDSLSSFMGTLGLD